MSEEMKILSEPLKQLQYDLLRYLFRDFNNFGMSQQSFKVMWFRFFHFCSFDPLPLGTSDSQLLPPLEHSLKPHLSFRFSMNCSIVTSSRSTKSDFPNSRLSSAAIPRCRGHRTSPKNVLWVLQDPEGTEEQKSTWGGRKRSAVDFWGRLA